MGPLRTSPRDFKREHAHEGREEGGSTHMKEGKRGEERKGGDGRERA